MAIRFDCACGHSIKAKDDQVGQEGTCPKCGATVRVPHQALPPDAIDDVGDRTILKKLAARADAPVYEVPPEPYSYQILDFVCLMGSISMPFALVIGVMGQARNEAEGRLSSFSPGWVVTSFFVCLCGLVGVSLARNIRAIRFELAPIKAMPVQDASGFMRHAPAMVVGVVVIGFIIFLLVRQLGQ